MRIGDVAGAREALAGELTYVGEGCYRQVYVDYETSTVYKIEYDDGIEEKANRVEWNRYVNRQYLNLPKGFRITPMRLLSVDGNDIIAARFIDGTRMGDCYCVEREYGAEYHLTGCISPDISEALADNGIDGSWGNIIFDGTTYWIVDAQ